MTETAWSDEGEVPPQKKSIPTWVWFCGAGCLAALILGIVAAVIGIKLAKNALDPDLQWPEIAKILPYDERPSELTPVFGMNVGVEQYVLMDSRGFKITIQRVGEKDAGEAREKLFETTPPEFPTNMVVMKFEDLASAKVEIQGREVSVLRMRPQFEGLAKKMLPAEAQEQMGSMLFADVTPEGAQGLVLLQMQRMKGGGPIGDDELRDLLRPFHVGPKR